jgi:hypothetical protein
MEHPHHQFLSSGQFQVLADRADLVPVVVELRISDLRQPRSERS